MRLYVALGLGVALIAPNLIWNLANSFATFAHTADNAKWGGSLLNIGKGFEFVGAQFGVFGPVLFAALLSTSWTAWRERLPEPDRLLLAFTLPVLAAVAAQAFVSRAHANWAATAYVAGTVLVIAVLLRTARHGWLKGSFALHTAMVAIVGLAAWQAGQFKLPFGADPFARTLGWKALAREAHETLEAARREGHPFGTVITDDRSLTAELLYYMRHDQTPVRAWWQGGRPHDHFELTRPFKAGAAEPVLLISVRRDASPVTERFDKVEHAGQAGHTRGPDGGSRKCGCSPCRASSRSKGQRKDAVMQLSGRTAIVTGSTSGIGHAIALALAKDGANIVVNGLGTEKDNERPSARCRRPARGSRSIPPTCCATTRSPK